MQDYKIYAMVICMVDEKFLNNLLYLSRNNPWLAHPTNQNYKTQNLKQSDYLLGFVSPNKYSLEITINKKWPENQSDSKEDKYKSPTLVYYKEIDAMVPLVKACLQTLPRMQGSWSNNDVETSKAMVESSRGMDNKLGPNVKGSPQYYHRRGH